MKTKLNKLFDAIIGIFLGLSALVAFIWLIKFSGIQWTPDEFVSSLWTSAVSITKTWGPLFIPAAAVIFVVKMLQTNVAHDVCALLEPRLQTIVANAISKSMSEGLDKQIAAKTLLGIRSIYRGVAAYADDDQELWHMYQKSSRDFRDVSGHPHIEIPAHP